MYVHRFTCFSFDGCLRVLASTLQCAAIHERAELSAADCFLLSGCGHSQNNGERVVTLFTREPVVVVVVVAVVAIAVAVAVAAIVVENVQKRNPLFCDREL